MTGDDAGDRLIAAVAVADPDADTVADPQPLAAPCVVDVDLDRSDGEKLVFLPGPREVAFGVPAKPAGEDPLERGALLLGGPRVEVQDPRPR